MTWWGVRPPRWVSVCLLYYIVSVDTGIGLLSRLCAATHQPRKTFQWICELVTWKWCRHKQCCNWKVWRRTRAESHEGYWGLRNMSCHSLLFNNFSTSPTVAGRPPAYLLLLFGQKSYFLVKIYMYFSYFFELAYWWTPCSCVGKKTPRSKELLFSDDWKTFFFFFFL